VKLSKDNLGKALELLAGQGTLLVPAEDDGVSKFTPWQAGDPLPALNLVNTILPPKDALFPQTEKMYKYKLDGQSASVQETLKADKQIIFGIRPCDMHSIDCLDKVFLTKTYIDTFYQAKREKLTTIAIGCTKAAETCFCESIGLKPGEAPLADVMLNEAGDGYAVKAQTPKGEEVIKLWQGILSNDEPQVTPAAKCSLSVDLNGAAEKLTTMFEHPIWDKVCQPCVGCGTCTYVCPTCYCFDINMETKGSEGTEFRCWDSCMFSDYTRMAGGHNPRPSKKERVRNRYMHKLSYFNERYGQTLCAGCGRCLAKCPVGMDITNFIDLVKEVK